jgi:hypothetical protein
MSIQSLKGSPFNESFIPTFYNYNYSPVDPYPQYKTLHPGNKTISNYDPTKNIPDSYASYEKYQQTSPTENYNRARVATQGFFAENDITKIFFSNDNVKRVQKMIKDEIYNRTKGQYTSEEDQDESDLTIAMRAIYLDKCKNLPGQTVRQVKLLNKQVVDYVVPDMITNIKQYYGYLKDIHQPLKPMMRPMNVSSAGRRLLPALTSVWR